MSRKRRYPTTIENKPASPAAAPAPSPLPNRGKWLRLLIVVSIAITALYVPVQTFRQIRAEMILKRTRAIMKTVPDSRQPEIDLRTALKLDPHNADAQSDLADFLVRKEMQKVERGDTASRSSEKLEQAAALLEQSINQLPSPKLRRRLGEVELMLAEVYTREGNTNGAWRAIDRAYNEFQTSGRMLPQPRYNNEGFNASALMTAAELDKTPQAMEYLHLMDRLRQGYVLRRGEMHGRAERIWLKSGMLAHQARELRYKLEQNPADSRTIIIVGRMARDLGMRDEMLAMMQDFERREKLSRDGQIMLAYLRDEPIPGAQSNDQTTSPTESIPQ